MLRSSTSCSGMGSAARAMSSMLASSGRVDKKGSYYYFQEENFAQGRENAKAYLQERCGAHRQDRDPLSARSWSISMISLSR